VDSVEAQTNEGQDLARKQSRFPSRSHAAQGSDLVRTGTFSTTTSSKLTAPATSHHFLLILIREIFRITMSSHRLFRFPKPQWLNSANSRTAGVYIAGALVHLIARLSS